ncbi:NAD(P)-dependent oxidoreductase [Ignavigranum ruoffiae]
MKAIIAIIPNLQANLLEKIKNICPNYEVEWFDQINPADYSRIEIIFGWNNQVKENLDQMKQLKWVQVESAGVDYLPKEIIENPDLMVSTTTGIHASAITESVFAYILGKGRGLYQSLKAQEDRTWSPVSAQQLHTLPGKCMLIFGTGNIGQEIARMASAFGMRVRGVNTNGRDIENFSKCYTLANARRMLNTAHIVVNAMPLTNETRAYFNRKFFADMNDQALFINIGRGGSVVEDDLYQAIQEKEIAGAYLDVFEEEPLSDRSPLWASEGITITPHITGQMHDYQDKVFPIFYENLQSYCQTGQLARNQLDKSKGY